MLQIHATQRIDQIEIRLRIAAQRHGGSILAVSHLGQLLESEQNATPPEDAITFTLCFADIYAALLRSEIRFAAFLPSRIAVCARGQGAVLETVSPRDCCRLLHRPDLESLAASLEDLLRAVMEDAANRQPQASGEHLATEDLVNMRAALPQRIDCHGTKIEELAGTGVHDAAGG
jgi:uncharacterized protein (DUF302 family)